MKPADEREEALFEAVVKLPVSARAEFLNLHCAGDGAVRRRIEELLTAHEGSGGFLEVDDEGQRTLLDDSIEHEQVGQKIGRYKLLERIGEGGCGVVYIAEQTAPIRRRVALKLIKLGMDTRQVVARFEAERQALAMMDHPNIAKVLDAGATERGRPYFVMELVRGVPITQYCDQHQLSTRARLELFMQVCHAIQHAHQKGIIHRDIKPSNILLTLHDGVPIPKVIDFGIAKAIEGRLSDTTVYTQLHQLVGTPAYMSPEQAEMSGLDIDTRTDIYSLGVALYELLVGQTPFNSKELVSKGVELMRKTIRETEPARPSACLAALAQEHIALAARRRRIDPVRLLTLLKGDLDWIVMKCLEKDRTRRYETANGLAMDIQRHLSNEPVVARPPSRIYRMTKTVRRHRAAFTMVAIFLGALIAGTIISLLLTVRARQAEQRAEREAERALAAERTAEAHSAAAVAQRIRAETSLYAADMNVVQEALAQNNLKRARERLNAQKPGVGTNDLRGWEWWHFHQLAEGDQNLVRFTQERRVIFLGPSSVPGHVLVAWEDGGLELWPFHSASAGKEVAKVEKGLQSVVADSSGNFLVTHAEDGTYQIWDQRDSTQLRLLHSGRSPAPIRAFSCKNKLLATVAVPGDRWELPESDRGLLSIVNYETGQELARLPDSGERAVFSRNEANLITGTGRGTVKVWRAPDLTLEKVLSRTGRGNHLTLAPNDSSLVICSFEGPVLCDLRNEDVSPLLNSGSSAAWPMAACFSANGAVFAVSYGDGAIGLWDAATRREIRRLIGHGNDVQALTFNSDGKWLISADSSGESIRVFSTERERNPEFSIGLLSSAVFTKDSKFLAVADRVGQGFQSVVWDMTTKQKRILLAEPNPLTFTRDGTTLITANVPVPLPVRIGTITGLSHWNLATEAVQRINFPRSYEVGAVALSPDEKVFAGGGTNGNVVLWDAHTGMEVGLLESSSGRVWNLKFSPDSRYLAVGIVGDVTVWELNGRKVVFRSAGLGLPLAFSPDGGTIAFSNENEIVLQNLSAPRATTLKGHRERVYWLAFSPDGRTLASAAEDLRLWSLAAGRDVASFRKAEHFMYVNFSPDGQMLVGGTVGKGYVWTAAARGKEN